MRFFGLISTSALVLSFWALPALAQAPSPAPSAPPAAAAAPAEDPTITKLARSQIDMFRDGKIDRSKFSAEASARIPDSMIAQVAQLLARGGAVKTFAYAGTVAQGGLQVSRYNVTFERPISIPEAPTLPTTDRWMESLSTDKDGRISYLLFAPNP